MTNFSGRPLVEFVLDVFGFLAVTLMLFLFVVKVIKVHKDKLVLAALTTISTVIVYFVVNSCIVYLYFINCPRPAWMIALNHASGIVAMSSFYVCLLFRFIQTFNFDPNYALSRKQTSYLTILLIIVCAIRVPNIFLDSMNAHADLAIACLDIIYAVCDILFNVVLLYVFFKRFFQIILRLDESYQNLLFSSEVRPLRVSYTNTNSSSNSIGSSTNTSVGGSIITVDTNSTHVKNQKLSQNRKKQYQIVDIMARVLLLTIVSEFLIHSCMALIVYFRLMERMKNDISEWYFFVASALFQLALLSMCFTVYMTFEFNDDEYFKCCSLCHKGLRYCCVRCVVANNVHHQRDNRDHDQPQQNEDELELVQG